MKKIRTVTTARGALALIALLGSTALGGGAAFAAESTADLQRQIQALQAQINSMQGMQDQLRNLQSQLDAVKASETAATNAAAATDAKLTTQVQADEKKIDDATKSFNMGIQNHNVKVTLGGFIELAGIERNHTESADVGSSFGSGIPFPNAVNDHLSEFRMSARQSRLSILAQTDVDPDQHLAAYYEMDFLGAAPTANSTESNSYNPRIRNIYATYTNSAEGVQVLAGQNWSLLTLNRSGINPRSEITPLTIDAQYVVGFNWTRNPQVRVVKNWDNEFWLGVSAESPQAVIYQGPNALQASPVTTSIAGSAQLGNGTPAGNFSTDPAPDLIAKAVLEPGWGHYELFGVQRWFRSRAAFTNTTVTGEGVGGSVLLPLVPKMLDFQASALYGKGLGRYGSGQLQDVTVDPLGHLNAIKYRSAMAGLVAHPDPAWDIYGYAGTEQLGKDAFIGTNGLGYGLGSPLYVNSGCETESTGTCTANTSREYQLAGGFWYRFYQGTFGTAQFGLQGTYTQRYIFAGVGPGTITNFAPTTNSTFVFASLRFYPF